jgi:hypothetical protein
LVTTALQTVAHVNGLDLAACARGNDTVTDSASMLRGSRTSLLARGTEPLLPEEVHVNSRFKIPERAYNLAVPAA